MQVRPMRALPNIYRKIVTQKTRISPRPRHQIGNFIEKHNCELANIFYYFLPEIHLKLLYSSKMGPDLPWKIY